METLRQRLRYDEIIKDSPPLMCENFIFRPDNFNYLKDFTVVHEETSLSESPLAFIRKIYLSHAEKRQNALHLSMILCWNGFRDAIEMLFRFAESFERPLPADITSYNRPAAKIGDFGLSWSWLGKENPDIFAFVKNNVLIILQGHNSAEITAPLAKEIDNHLARLSTVPKDPGYPEEKEGIFSGLKGKSEIPKIRAGERFDLGKIFSENRSLFFLTTSGSVNRDMDIPDAWYYRAGMQKGKQEITLFSLESGILPKKERFIIEII